MTVTLVTLLKRREGMSKADFVAYYETHHRRIGERVLAGWATRYVRRFLFPSDGEDQLCDADVVMEIDFPDAATRDACFAAMVDPGWWMLLETAAVFLIGEPLVGQIVEPLLFGSQTRLSPLAVLLGTAFWTLLWGPVGLVLAVPLTLAVVVMGQHIPRLEFLRILLGNEPVLEPQEQLYHQLLAGEAIEAAKEADRWTVSAVHPLAVVPDALDRVL